ncbi:MAG: VWA domain-containing protein [Planctomycetaceae bacterium]|nr:VWA domain-containing protein [Planctomycetaceae bacterium]
MFQFFLNPWLLFGLAGIGLPILAHLLSRRRYDVVEWAAMQFLNPSRKTRRRLKLEELLLLLVRIGLICLMVLSVTRPWIPGGWLSGHYSAGSRTVVIVIDGSNSMSRTDGPNSIHQNALRQASQFLQTLGVGDSVALIDARDQPRAVIESPLSDLGLVEQEIRRLPPPGGACGILPALEKAIAILGRSSDSSREVVVFSDQQANSWRSEDEAEWARFDDLIRFPSVRPHVWLVDVSPHSGVFERNISVGRIELSREMTVPDFAVRLQVRIHNDSSSEANVPLRLLLDGQPLADKHHAALVPALGDAVVQFEYAFRTEGTHVLSVEAEISDEAVAADNVSHAAVRVEKSLDVLLVNGTPSPAPETRDTFFAELAFAPLEGKPPWVKTRLVEAAELVPDDFQSASAVIFCNCPAISSNVAQAAMEFVASGNGLFIACGSNTTPESFHANFIASGLMPQLQLLRTRKAPPQSEQMIRVAPLSLQPGWLDRFHSDPARSFLKATFDAWCIVRSGPINSHSSPADPAPNTTLDPTVNSASKALKKSELSNAPLTSAPVVLASLTSGDPLLLESRCGDGLVLTMTTSLDRSWTDLPTRSDFVPFLHEAVFYAASSRSHWNVDFGEPLIARFPRMNSSDMRPEAGQFDEATPDSADSTVTFKTPGGDTSEVTLTGSTAEKIWIEPDKDTGVAVFRETFVPGVYSATTAAAAAENFRDDFYVVNYDHTEDQQTPLTATDRARLTTNDRIRFSSSIEDLAERMYRSESITELWSAILAFFLFFLVLELYLTGRIIRQGYGNESLTV